MDDKKESVGVVIPVFNEAVRLNEDEYLKFAKKYPQVILLLVNDGSTDGTLKKITHLSENQPNIHILNKTKNEGKGEAIRSGAQFFEQHFAPVKWLGFMDGDLATPFSELEIFLDSSDFGSQELFGIFGSRFKCLGASISRNEVRHYMGRVMATLISRLLRLPIYDSQCGFKFFKPNCFYAICKEPFLSKWLFDVEMIIRVGNHFGEKGINGLKERPLNEWNEIPGSKVRPIDFVLELVQLYRIKLKYKHSPYFKLNV